MKKAVISLVILLLTGALLFATGGQEEAAPAPAQTEEKAPAAPQSIQLSWSSISTAETALSKAMQKFKFEVERLSGGRISADLYNGGQIFTQEGELAAAREGTLDMAYYAAGWVAEWTPYLGQLNAVYTFTGYDHMRVLR